MQLAPDIGVELSSDNLHDITHRHLFPNGTSLPELAACIVPNQHIYLTRSGQFILLDTEKENSVIEIVEFGCELQVVLKGLLAVLLDAVEKRQSRLVKLRGAVTSVRRRLLSFC